MSLVSLNVSLGLLTKLAANVLKQAPLGTEPQDLLLLILPTLGAAGMQWRGMILPQLIDDHNTQ